MIQVSETYGFFFFPIRVIRINGGRISRYFSTENRNASRYQSVLQR